MNSDIATGNQVPPCALRFDKAGDFVDIGKRAEHQIQRDITMEAWINAARQVKYAGIVSRIYDTGATESGYGLMLDGASGIYGGIRTVGGPAGDFYFTSGPNTLPLGEWHHVAATYDGRQVALYVDGEQVKTHALSGPINYNPDNNLSIGAYRDNDEHYEFPGHIAEVRLWSVVRTQAEIKADMNVRLRGDEPGLAGYWRLDEGAGDTAKDRSKSAVDGRIGGAKWEAGAGPALAEKAPEPVPGGVSDQVLKNLEQQIAALEQRLADRDQKCDAHTQRLNALEERIAGAEQVNADLAEQNQRLTEQNQKLADQSRQLADQSKQLADQSKQLAEQNQKLTDQSRQLAEQNQKLTDQSRQLVEQNQKLAEQDKQLAEQSKQLAAQDRKLAELGKQLTEVSRQDWQLVEQNAQLAESQEVDDIPKRIAELATKLGETTGRAY